MRFSRIACPALTAASFLAIASAANAAEPAAEEPASPFALRAEVEVTVLLTATAAWTLPKLFDGVLAPGNCQPCDPGDVNAFDRTVIGSRDDGARIASDVGAWGLPLLAGLGSLIDVKPFGWSAALEDVVLVAESVAISGAVSQMVKNASKRPRPYMYDADTAAEKGRARENFQSFYSGHTAIAFSASVAFAYVFSVRRPDDPWRYAVWAFGITAASAVGVCRVLAGAHFWTDVITGAAMSSALGVLTPALHLRGNRAKKGPQARAVAGPGFASLYIRF